MDLNISGRTAIVCAPRKAGTRLRGSAGGRGRQRVINGRMPVALPNDDTNQRVARGTVTAVAADITTQEGQAKLLGLSRPGYSCKQQAGPNPG